MKKTTFLAFITLLLFNSANAQVLLNDNFDNYKLGNLGTDPNGIIPGQGGWFTEFYNNTTSNNSAFTVTNEPFKGKALTITVPKDETIYLSKDLSIFIDQLTAGNNVIKFEIDYYTGPQYYLHSGSGPNTSISLLSNHQYPLFSYAHNLQYQVDNIHAAFNDGLSLNRTIRLGNGAFYGLDQLPINTWITFIVYLDYTNKKIYFETPYFIKLLSAIF